MRQRHNLLLVPIIFLRVSLWYLFLFLGVFDSRQLKNLLEDYSFHEYDVSDFLALVASIFLEWDRLTYLPV